LEKRVRSDHPLRAIREIANAALAALTGTFEPLYSPLGRSSIPPERLMAGAAGAGLLFDPLGAAVGRAG